MALEQHNRCVIIGSGPAGFTAAIYASRANLSPLVIEGPQPGGQLTTTTEIENFPGYPEKVTGIKLMEDLRAQAITYGANVFSGRVTEVDFSNRPFKITVDGKQTITADAVIISTGATARYLGLPDEQKYMGMGVSACATCDGFFYRKRTVAVVGGGDTAAEEALYLAGLASKVYLIVRRDKLRASKVMQQRVFDNPKIEILFNTNTVGLFGNEVLEGAHLVANKGTENENYYDIAIDGFFLAIGHKPNTEIFAGQIDLDEQGYIKVAAPSTKTNIDGVFAAGDVADPIYQQAISAAGTGCRAAIDLERFLIEHEEI
ncbi:MAG: thioredoxin-disulfide reductase [Muribaculaceae bacterium]|nr:thioredoxin-disulfide reductase [Muribaculaceae bacterium]